MTIDCENKHGRLTSDFGKEAIQKFNIEVLQQNERIPPPFIGILKC